MPRAGRADPVAASPASTCWRGCGPARSISSGFGGHRAAAGLEIDPDRIDQFREAFLAHASAEIGNGERVRTERIDAMVGGDGLGLALAEELERLGPFGAGNPNVSLLVPSARVRDVRGMGEGKHSRFNLHSGVNRALTVAFGRSSIAVGEDEAIDAAVRLEINQWNGAVEPRLVLREMYRLGEADGLGSPPPLGSTLRAWSGGVVAAIRCGGGRAAVSPGRPRRAPMASNERSCGAAARLRRSSPSSSRAETPSCCSRPTRRAAPASPVGAAGLPRFAAGAPLIACGRCPLEEIEALGSAGGGRLAMADYAALALAENLAPDYQHVVLVDPPASAA